MSPLATDVLCAPNKDAWQRSRSELRGFLRYVLCWVAENQRDNHREWKVRRMRSRDVCYKQNLHPLQQYSYCDRNIWKHTATIVVENPIVQVMWGYLP